MSNVSDFIAAIRSVVGDAPVVGLHEPDIGEAEHRYVAECLDSTFVSSVGPFVTRFEEEVAAFTGAKHAVAVSNGTVALQVALVLAGVRPGDEVLVPALSFIASANAVSHAGAVPHFVDSSASTLSLSPPALAAVLSGFDRVGEDVVNPSTGRRVSAIVPMHAMGHPAEMVQILAIGAEYGIPIVEDAAESLGSFIGDKHTGTFGTIAALSFNGNKIVTTGGGGMILTDDDDLGRRAKHLTTTAKLPHPWEFEHDEIAWNFRMPNLNAAMGVAQLSKLDRYLADKRMIAERYATAFAGLDGFDFIPEPAGTTSNYWLCTVRIEGVSLAQRDEYLQAANDAGLKVRPFWNLLSEQLPYRESPRGDLSTASALLDSVISLPSSPKLAG